jgi:glycosyltransferase involved in cell wall biosynthesis
MRLLLFNLATDTNDPILGFTTRWIRALAKRVEFIHVITMRAGKVEVPGNVQVYSVGKEKGYGEPRRVLEFYRYLFQILRKDHVDVCFSHMIPIFTVLAAPVLRAKGIPIITWYAHRQVTLTLKLAHHLSDLMVSINEDSYPYRQNKLVSLGHGVDTDLFSPADTQPENPPLLLSVGRLSPIKDPMTLIEAVYLLRQRGYEIRCVLLGDAPERDRVYAEAVRQRVSELGLDKVVQFVGSVPNEQVVHWYRRCFAHLNCSPADHSLDKAVLEAMACGKPSLSSTLGFEETMGEQANLLLFKQKDAENLAEKLAALLKLSLAERERIGLYLRERVIKMHSLERLADKLVNIFVQQRR